MTLGLFFGLYYFWKLGRDEHWQEIPLFDAFFLSLASYFVIGRVGYVMIYSAEFESIFKIFAILSHPGIIPAVGIVGSLITITLFAKSRDWDLWKALDCFAVSLTLIFVFSSIGAFLNGSNPGRPVSWGVMYPGLEGKVIPVDLWSFVYSLLSFMTVMRVKKNFRFYSWYKGELSVAQDGLAFLVFTASVGIYYMVRGFIESSLSVPMIVAGPLIILSSIYLIYRRSGRRPRVVVGQTNSSVVQWLRKLLRKE